MKHNKWTIAIKMLGVFQQMVCTAQKSMVILESERIIRNTTTPSTH